MADYESLRRDRRETHPALGDRKLKLGTFQTNLDSACVMSSLEDRFRITWPNTRAAAQLADDMEFEALVPVARWRGFGGATNPQGPGFETYTWAAGLAASTDKAGITSTSHVSINHPIVAAKQSTVIDHISNGRYILNIVTGWNTSEMEMFGAELMAHADRYEMAEEWLSIVMRLWTEDEEFDHQGRFYNIKKGYLQPKPIQSPYPVLMNAGSSERGRHFAAKHCDLVFINFRSQEFDDCKARVEGYRQLAREEYGRDIKVWSLAYIVQRETEKEARDFHDYYVNELGDWEAANNCLATMSAARAENKVNFPASAAGRFIAGWAGMPLIGTKEQVVDGLQRLSDIGLDGVLLSWPRFVDEMRVFRDETYPLAVQAGLR